MNARLKIVLVAALLLAAASAVGFELSWTDQYGETSYTLVGPDSVAVGQEFTVTISAADPLYPGDMVAAPWNFQVDGQVVDSGFGIFLSNGVWTETYSFSFDAPAEPLFLFTAQDMGNGGGAHGWEWFELTGSTHIIDLIPVEAGSFSLVKSLY